MKLGFYKLGLINPIVRTIFAGMYSSFFHALEKTGFETKLVFDFEFKGLDVLVVPFGEGQEKDSAQAIERFDGPVVVYTTPAANWFKPAFIKRWHHRILFVYSTDASDYSRICYDQFNLPHLHLPFGSDDTVFQPIRVPKIYDVLFIANAWSGTGRYQYIDQLIKKSNQKKWNIMLFGGGWEKYGFSQQLIGHGSLLNLLYNSSKININLFNDEQTLGKEKCLDANNRLFDLAMAGCFQICNAPSIVRNYFASNEVISEHDPEGWLAKIEFYLEHEETRNDIALKGRERASSDHTWMHRAISFKNCIDKYLPQFSSKRQDVSLSSSILRKIDCSLPSFYPVKTKAKKAIQTLSKKIN